MIRNFDGHVLDFKGAATKETVSDTILAALNHAHTDEPSLSGASKARRGELARKIAVGGDIDLNVEELALIKLVTGKFCNPLGVSFIWDLLDDRKPAATPERKRRAA